MRARNGGGSGRVWVCLILLTLGSGWTSAEGEIEEAVGEAIRQRHPEETGDWWRALGPGAPRVIITMYAEEKQSYHRVRLIEGLAWFPDVPEAVEFLRGQAVGAGPTVMRQSAIRSLGISQGAGAVALIAKCLADQDAQIRLVAAQTLRKIPGAEARAALNRYLSGEKAEWVVAKLRAEELSSSSRSQGGASAPRLTGEADLSGTWRGVWLSPRAKEAGFSTAAATLKLSRGAPGAGYAGECVLASRGPKEKAPRRWLLEDGNFQDGRVRGRLRPAETDPARGPLLWEAELWGPETGGLQLLLRVRGSGQLFVGRRVLPDS